MKDENMDKTVQRFNIVSAYIHNQTDESWERMKSAIRQLEGEDDVLHPAPPAPDDDNDGESATMYLNHYRCTCGHEWTDKWNCMCNDRCPKCDTEIEPYQSEEVGQAVKGNDNREGTPMQDYALNIDGQLFRAQRELLLKLADLAQEGRPYKPAPGDSDLLDGLIGLTDELADQAHDRHGIDCLLSEDDEEESPEGQP
jgi:hypothetical protein